MKKLGSIAAGSLIALLGACGGSDPESTSGSAPGASSNCANPDLPAQAIDGSITDDVPTDFDPTADPQLHTTLYFTALLPPRCASDRFPLVLHSHGYGGSRITQLAADGTLKPDDPMFPSIDELAQALPYHGYVVISFDQRGHGQSTDARARIVDPAAETQDARALLDYAYDHAADLNIQTEPGTGVPKDVKVGTLGYSYGGAFQLPLAALDPRIDTLVPIGAWHNLLYSLLPGDAVKLSFDGLLCLLAATGGVKNTPLVQALCNKVGVQNPLNAYNVRSRADLVRVLNNDFPRPRKVPEDEMIQFFYTHGMAYFRNQQQAGGSWGFGESSARLRKVPALFLQGNRDVLFNLTEAYWNWRYFAATGADVRLLSAEGGHMNPLANQTEGSANCGTVVGVNAVLGWFDHYLKGVASTDYDAIPRVCLSVADTVKAPDVTPAGLELDAVPVGALSGSGAVPAKLDTLSAELRVSAAAPVFVPVITIEGGGRVLAGVPSMASLTVRRGAGALGSQSTNAFVGVGIVRGGQTILVDDQLTAFTEGEHRDNRNVSEGDRILLPAVGERLLDGDQVGLLFYPQHVQYAAIVGAEGLSGLTGIINYALGSSIPPVTSALEPLLGLLYIDPYSVSASDVELPILVPGQYPHSRLVQ